MSDWRGSLLTGFDWQPCAAWLNAVAHKSCADNVSPSLLTTQVTAECVYALLTWHRCSNCTLFYANYQLCWLEWVFNSRGHSYCQLGCLKNRPLAHLVNFFSPPSVPSLRPPLGSRCSLLAFLSVLQPFSLVALPKAEPLHWQGGPSNPPLGPGTSARWIALLERSDSSQTDGNVMGRRTKRTKKRNGYNRNSNAGRKTISARTAVVVRACVQRACACVLEFWSWS